MKSYLFSIIISILFAPSIAYTQEIINTISGNGTHAYSGDDVPASTAEFQYPVSICRDTFGNIFAVDLLNSTVREIDVSTNIIHTIAGNPTTSGNSGDAGSAIYALLNYPLGICTDRAGNIYIADTYNNEIRKITVVDGIINTIAGNGIAGFSGDGGVSTAASINIPFSVGVDDSNNVYIDDALNNRIRKVNALTGIISTIAGTGVSGATGDGGPAITAELDTPQSIAVDHLGNVYIADYNNAKIRMINASTGIITTIAGTGAIGYSGDDGPATLATFNSIIGISIDDSANLYIADEGVSVIRKIRKSTGIIETIAGTGFPGFSGDGGSPTSASLNYETGVCTNGSGTIIDIADKLNGRIREITNHTLSVSSLNTINNTLAYPNPSQGKFTIVDNESSNYEITITNLLGELIYRSEINSHKTTVDITSQPPGIYLLYITSNGESQCQKVTISNK